MLAFNGLVPLLLAMWVATILSFPAMAAVPAVKSVMVTDVTTVSFSVIWASSEASSADLEVFLDENGTTPVPGVVITPYPLCGTDSTIKTLAENNGVMKVRVTGLQANTAYFFRTLTTSKSTSDTVAYPVSTPLPQVTTKLRTVRSFISGLAEIPFSNDVIIEPCYLEDGSTPAAGTLLIATIEGAKYPLTAFVGDGVDLPYALIDLNNVFNQQTKENINLSQGKNLTLLNFRGVLRNSIVTHSIPFDESLSEIKVPEPRLEIGANFVSFQLEPANPNTEAVLNTIYSAADSIWAFNKATGTWIFWDKTSPPFLKKLKELHGFTGFWLIMNTEASWFVNGNFSNGTIQLTKGSNLVGSRSIETKEITEAIAAIYGQVESVWTFDQFSEKWIFWDKTSPPFLKKLKTIEPGKAYWVIASEDCQW